MPTKDLLHLDRAPTLEELRAFFKENDFTRTVFKEYDYDALTQKDKEELEFMHEVKKEMNRHWEPLAHEKGMKSASICYGKDNPLIAMRDRVQSTTGAAAIQLLENQPDEMMEAALSLLETFAEKSPETIAQQADEMLHNMVNLTMDTMQFEDIAAIVKEMPAKEDFNYSQKNNQRVADFNRKWGKTRAQMKTVSLEALQEHVEGAGRAQKTEADAKEDTAEDAAANVLREKFWDTLAEKDKQIVQLKMAGYSQAKIAEQLGYKTHSAVTKRLQKMREVFAQIAQ